MDMMRGPRIAAAGLTDWRKLAQGLHARYLVEDFAGAARFVTAIGEAGDEVDHHPRVVIGSGHVDLELVTPDAIYRTDAGEELVVEWVTQTDLDLAQRITEIAAGLGLAADPRSVSECELGLDTGESGLVAPVWAALLTGDSAAQGRGTPDDEIRDATVRVPNLWFGDAPAEGSHQRVHIEVYVPPDVVAERLTAVVAAGGTVVDDSESPGLTVIADQEGNRGVLCADTSAADTTAADTTAVRTTEASTS